MFFFLCFKRYEDVENGFGIGANIETIFIKNGDVTTSSSSASTSDEFPKNFSFKLFEAINFCIYTNQKTVYNNQKLLPVVINPTDDSNNEQIISDDELVRLMNFSNFQTANQIDFLVRPITFQAELVRDLSQRALRKRKSPRIRVSTVLNDFSLELSQTQCEQFARVIESLNVYKNQLAAVDVPRPAERVGKKNVKQWWVYFSSCVRCNLKKRLGWDEFHKWSRDVNIYTRYHTRLLKSRISHGKRKSTPERLK